MSSHRRSSLTKKKIISKTKQESSWKFYFLIMIVLGLVLLVCLKFFVDPQMFNFNFGKAPSVISFSEEPPKVTCNTEYGIIVLGNAGSGKTHILDSIVGSTIFSKSENRLDGTQAINVNSIQLGSVSVKLIDTPGFDNPFIDEKVLIPRLKQLMTDHKNLKLKVIFVLESREGRYNSEVFKYLEEYIDNVFESRKVANEYLMILNKLPQGNKETMCHVPEQMLSVYQELKYKPKTTLCIERDMDPKYATTGSMLPPSNELKNKVLAALDYINCV
jgi:GTP-binding protein EngB required for normal cell division